MLPLLFSLISATLFGIAAYLTYGPEGFIHSGWIELVLSTVILAGIVVSFMGESSDCLSCRLRNKL